MIVGPTRRLPVVSAQATVKRQAESAPGTGPLAGPATLCYGLTLPMARFDLIVFDVDDTLLDFRRSQRVAFDQCVREAAPQVSLDEAHQTYVEISRGLWDALEQGRLGFHRLAAARWELLGQRLGLTYDVATLSARYLNVLSQQGHACDGALQTLQSLNTDHRLGAVTNGYEAVQAPRLSAAAMDHHLEFVVTSEAAGAAKPASAIFERALRLAGGEIEPSRVLMVGDSLSSDIDGGNRMGFVTCWVSRGACATPCDIRPDHKVRRLSELLAIARA